MDRLLSYKYGFISCRSEAAFPEGQIENPPVRLENIAMQFRGNGDQSILDAGCESIFLKELIHILDRGLNGQIGEQTQPVAAVAQRPQSFDGIAI